MPMAWGLQGKRLLYGPLEAQVHGLLFTPHGGVGERASSSFAVCVSLEEGRVLLFCCYSFKMMALPCKHGSGNRPIAGTPHGTRVVSTTCVHRIRRGESVKAQVCWMEG